jgi:hypothetical protein
MPNYQKVSQIDPSLFIKYSPKKDCKESYFNQKSKLESEPKISISRDALLNDQNVEGKENPNGNPISDVKFRADYTVKFSILRKAYPTMNIPDITPEESRDSIKQRFEAYCRRIKIDHSVETNKKILIGIWLLIEIAGLWIGFPMEGFSQSQSAHISKYKDLLIKLAEQSDGVLGYDKWPIQIQILIMILTNAFFYFILSQFSGFIDPKKVYMWKDKLEAMFDNTTPPGIIEQVNNCDSENPPVDSTVSDEAGSGADFITSLLPSVIGRFMNSDKTEPKKQRPTAFGARRKQKPENKD